MGRWIGSSNNKGVWFLLAKQALYHIWAPIAAAAAVLTGTLLDGCKAQHEKDSGKLMTTLQGVSLGMYMIQDERH